MPQRGRGRYEKNRDRNRSRSRSSRRDNKNKGKSNNTESKRKKKTLEDHIFYVGRAQDASDYVTNAKFIIRHIQTTYEKGADITTALKEEKHFDFSTVEPRLKMSTADQTQEQTKYMQETAENMKQYEIKMKSHMAR